MRREAALTPKGTRIAGISGLRGIVGDGLDPATAVEFAAAYASSCEPGAILVGHDGRATAPVFVPAIISGVAATGRDVLLAGAVATPTLGRLVRELKAVGGIQISASHNPPQYNGLKFFQPAGMVLSKEKGQAMLARFEAKDLGWVAWNQVGKIRELTDVDSSHLQAVLAIVDVEAIRAKNFGVVLDACHGAGGRLGAALLRALGCRPLVLGGEPDGLYDHPPEPTETNLKAFRAMVSAFGAAVGFAQDPDADRLAVVDEAGTYIGEELTLALAASHLLEQKTGPIVLNLSTSLTTEVLARDKGCVVHRTPVGEIHVVERMIRENAILGGEGNGGVIDPRVGFVRDSFAAMALILDRLAKTDEPLSKLVAALPRFSIAKTHYPLSGSGGASKVAALWERIAANYPDAQADHRDGLHLKWADRWVHARASNTEPIVRVIAEAPDAAEAERMAAEVGRVVVDSAQLVEDR